jgi:hypothetical protein
MATCSDKTYLLKHTDLSKANLAVPKSSLITGVYDIAIVGKTRLNYGEIFNENVLHILENFSCPEDGSTPDTPDLSIAYGDLLENPIEGQTWYNSTSKRFYVYNGVQWKAISNQSDVAGNYGVIAHGQSLPQPVNNDGYVFPYSECSFVVSPFAFLHRADGMTCEVDSNGVVTMTYTDGSTGLPTSGYANYQIIGIKSTS